MRVWVCIVLSITTHGDGVSSGCLTTTLLAAWCVPRSGPCRTAATTAGAHHLHPYIHPYIHTYLLIYLHVHVHVHVQYALVFGMNARFHFGVMFTNVMCRRCGRLVCKDCSLRTIRMEGDTEEKRACDGECKPTMFLYR